MFNNKSVLIFILLLSLFALSCGGGGGGKSSVTAVSLEAETTVLLPGGRTMLTAEVQGSLPDSDPYWDRVRFSFRDNNSGASLDVIDSRLDGNLQARAIYIAGSNPGIDVVQVSFESGARAAVTITVGYAVNEIRLEQFGWDVLATAFDDGGFPVPDAQLDFFITAGTITSSAVTNQNGVAQVSFTLPVEVNSARVTASSGTVSSTLDVVRTFQRSVLKSGKTEHGSSQTISGISLEQEGNDVIVRIRDKNGDFVPGVKVFFELEHGVLDDPYVFTNDDGEARQMFLLSKDVDQAEVFVYGGGMSASFVLVN